MFAVVKTGGKQYRVEKGDVVKVERLDGEAGDTVDLTDVIMLDKTVGTPTVKGASVKAEILEQSRADKVTIFKKKKRQGYRRKKGHRQPQTVLKIKEIKKS